MHKQNETYWTKLQDSKSAQNIVLLYTNGEQQEWTVTEQSQLQ